MLDLPETEWLRVTLLLSTYTIRAGALEETATLLTEVEKRSGKSISTAIRRLTRALFLQDPKLVHSCILSVQHHADPKDVQVKIACMVARGIANLQLGHPDRASRWFRKARYLNDETLRNPNYDLEARLRQAEASIASGAHPKRAIDQTTEVIGRLEEVTQPLLAIEVYRVHAAALRLVGRTEESDAAYARAADQARSSDHVLYRYLALRDHARALLFEVDSRPAARPLLESAVARARGCVPAFDHPSFGWEIRVYEVLAGSKLAREHPLAGRPYTSRGIMGGRAVPVPDGVIGRARGGRVLGDRGTIRRRARR